MSWNQVVTKYLYGVFFLRQVGEVCKSFRLIKPVNLMQNTAFCFKIIFSIENLLAVGDGL